MKEFYAMLKNMISANQAGLWGLAIQGDAAICPTGSKLLLNQNGQELAGEVSTELVDIIKDQLSRVELNIKPQVLELFYSGSALRFYLEPFNSKAQLLILGGGHIALPLASIGKLLDYQVTVVDDRPSFANTARFPQVDQVICDDFQKTIRRIPFDINTYIIIVTRGHQHDRTCLDEVLHKAAWAYTGMIGSRRKVTAVMKELQESGVDPALLNRVHTPIGLDIGAQTPEEIAVSIMAEIIMIQNKGFSNGLGRMAGVYANG